MNTLPPLPEPDHITPIRGLLYSKSTLISYATAAVAAALAPVTKPTKHYQPQRWPFAPAHDHERQEVTGLSIPETPDA